MHWELCVYVCACMHTYMYKHSHVLACMYVYACVGVCVCVHAYYVIHEESYTPHSPSSV